MPGEFLEPGETFEDAQPDGRSAVGFASRCSLDGVHDPVQCILAHK